MTDIIISEARDEDAEIILEHMKIVGAETDNLTFGSEGIGFSRDEEAAFLERVAEDPHSVFYCAWKGSELVGTINMNGLPRRMSHRAEMGISVLKSEWNHGVGSMLMSHLVEYAKTHGIEMVNLEVREDNIVAIHLYEKFGFKKTGSIPAFFKIGNEYVDFDIMSLDLR
jgi:RimJ/RimL family protein N-acetyltransferase